MHEKVDVGLISQCKNAERIGFRHDTRLIANCNQGHEYGTALSEQEKNSLVEYLKTL